MKLALPRWTPPGLNLQRGVVLPVPLALTLLTTLLLLLIPSLLLLRLPRPQAIGLEKLMANVSLLQSFRADPERPLPPLWRQRFGEGAGQRLWRSQTRTWWQFWDGHSEGDPFLALPSRGLPEALLRTVPVPPLPIGDLLIFSPDPLSRQILRDRLEPQVRRSAGLRQRCLLRLRNEQAVFWRPTGLGSLLGPLATFLQDFQEGCLTLSIRPDGLLWEGEAASVEGMLLQATPRAAAAPPALLPPSPSGDGLLEVQGRSLEALLSGLLARELIREPLADRYGLGPEQLSLLRGTPFRLLLRPQASGAFQASVELTVGVGTRESQWRAALNRLSVSLQKQGLRSFTPSGSMLLWQRPDGVTVGGWSWVPAQGPRQQITLFLGSPSLPSGPWNPAALLGSKGMVLSVRPRELEKRGLLPPDLPEVVKRSSLIWGSAETLPGSVNGGPLSQVQGVLTLQP